MAVTDTENSRTGDRHPQQDRGWAWVIAFAGMLAICMGLGVSRTLGLLLVELMDVYETTTTEVSLIVTGSGIGMCVTALALTLGLGDIFHERALLVIASLITSLGFIVTYFSTKIEEVFVLGLCSGAAMQIGQACSASLTGKYFKKRLTLGIGIVWSGVSLGTLALPPLVRWLFDQYTYRGAALIMAAISLNILISAALMRPFKTNKKESDRTPTINFVSYQMETMHHNISSDLTDSKTQPTPVFTTAPVTHVPAAHTEKVGEQLGNPIYHVSQNSELRQWGSLGDSPRSSKVQQTATLMESGPQITEMRQMLGLGVAVDTPQLLAIFRIKGDNPHLNRSAFNSQNELQQTRVSRCKSIGISLRDFAIRPTKYRPKQDSVWAGVSLSFRFFKDPSFVFLQLFIYFATVGCECLIQFYPAFTKEVGLSDYQSVFLLSIVGGADLAGRIFYGLIGDCCFLHRYNLLMFPICIVVIACFLSQFASLFWSQVIFAVTIGFNYGACYSFRAVLIVDLFGRSTLLRRMGITNFMTGLAYASSGPIIGSIWDATGTFKLPLQIVGVMFICSCLCLLCIGIHQRCRRRLLQSG